MTRKIIVCLLASLMIRIETARAQAITGQVMRLQPTTLPATCNNGDLRSDINNTFLLNICSGNVWGPVSPGSGGAAINLGNLSNVAVNTVIKPNANNAIALGASTAAWSSVFATTFVGALNGTATFANAAGTSSVTTAFASIPTACAAGVWANAIGANGNLTCAIVSTASTSGTAFFAATSGTAAFTPVAGTASFAATSGTASFATTSSTASTSGTAFFSATSGTASFATASSTASTSGTDAFANAFSGTVAIVNGGTGQISSTAAFAALAPTQAIANLGLPLVSGGNSVPASWNVLSVAAGGTNNTALSTTAGGVLFMDGSKVVNMGAGTSGQGIRSAGAGTPVWRTVITTKQVLSSGTTYTVPTGAQAIYIEEIGGGGGGQGSGTSGGGVGGNGTNSTFSTTVAGGGSNSGPGGTVSGCDANFLGGPGGGAGGGGTTGAGNYGGNGGNGWYGAGGGLGGSNSPAAGATAGGNSGAGGGGGGGKNGAVTAFQSGIGGGGGGFCQKLFSPVTPGATYPFTIGAGGTAGTAGTSGVGGGAGGSGLIIVTEFY